LKRLTQHPETCAWPHRATPLHSTHLTCPFSHSHLKHSQARTAINGPERSIGNEADIPFSESHSSGGFGHPQKMNVHCNQLITSTNRMIWGVPSALILLQNGAILLPSCACPSITFASSDSSRVGTCTVVSCPGYPSSRYVNLRSTNRDFIRLLFFFDSLTNNGSSDPFSSTTPSHHRTNLIFWPHTHLFHINLIFTCSV
jgi:hypothetical protein